MKTVSREGVMTICAILRAPQFSPNAAESDSAVMQAVVERLCRRGHEVSVWSETALERLIASSPTPDLILSMGRLPETLAWLGRQACRVVNTPQSVASCSREVLEHIMRLHRLPAAPQDGVRGYWLKRADGWAQEADDVQYCADRAALAEAIKGFSLRGISRYVVSAHVEGDVVKFYGVRGTDFFRWFYPTDDGQTKFGLERRNGEAHHYAFAADCLRHDANRLAALTGLEIYGGDCIVQADGSYCIIDFNDWPSFSRCRDEAADAMVELVLGEGGNDERRWLKAEGNGR